MIVIGIDPGLGGAVAVLNRHGSILRLEDTPTFQLSGKREYDVRGMADILRDYTEEAHAFIERQVALPRENISAAFKLGVGYGVWLGILGALGIPHTAVSPQVWQRDMYHGAVGEGKDRSLLVASRLWPDLKIPRTRHDRADALLIAEYARRVLLGIGLGRKRRKQ